MQHNFYTSRKKTHGRVLPVSICYQSEAWLQKHFIFLICLKLFTDLGPDLTFRHSVWIHQRCATSYLRKMQCCFWNAVVIVWGFDQVPCAVLWVVLHIWVDIFGAGSRNIRSPLMIPPWILPGVSWVEFGEGPGLTHISHLGIGTQEGLASTASSTSLGKVDVEFDSRPSSASGTKISHPS